MSGKHEIVVAGHICLDLIPRIDTAPAGRPIITPGALTMVGPCVTATGGVVSNTGVSLHRLGVPVKLIGRVGDDPFGREILRMLQTQGNDLASGMTVVSGDVSSYSLVISPPGVDRSFLHCPGANDHFGPEDVDLALVRRAKIVHFGYPPVMKRMYENGGAELAAMYQAFHQTGATTSLDMCAVDAGSAAARVDWHRILKATLPHVDLFLPSFEEFAFMLGRAQSVRDLDVTTLRSFAGEAIEMGCAVVMLKLGELGLYLRTTKDPSRLKFSGRAGAALSSGEWLNREVVAPSRDVNLISATGAGDAAIAGFLAAILRGEPPEQALAAAAAVGASCCEAADATSGVKSWSEIKARLDAGWNVRKL